MLQSTPRPRCAPPRLPTLAGAALLACASLSGAAADTLERRFDTGPSGTLRLESDVGSVLVTSGTEAGVEITVHRDGADGEALEVTFEQRGNDIRVSGELDERRRRRMDIDVEYHVRLPRGFSVDVTSGAGSIDVDDLDGDAAVATAGGFIRLASLGGTVRARTAGGSIDLDTAGGDATLETAGGAIDVNRAGGRVEARTAGGSITIDDAGGQVTARTAGGSIRIGASGGSVEAHTSGGSVTVEDVRGAVVASTNGGSVNATIRSQPSGDSELRTQGGSVSVTLAPGVALDIDAASSHSRVTSDFDFPDDAWSDERSRLRASLNGGGPRLTLRASHRVRLRRE